ncbi:hypothetical protein GCE9029_03241 [Grimontia celer]|uniref:Uncharacterized protein n=1 Tax=Grimontia celer TaxID=1796497 RepID=A0A128F7V2_9GAMM|nr:hypothetical protein [Grimontia celer]CZF82454.1 hypothetical protein GCE9029_03241 [Grimontia celer]
MKVIKVILKGVLGLFFVFVFIGTGYYFYDLSQQKKQDEKELNYASQQKWSWYDEYERIQISEFVEGRSILRKVNLQNKYVIYAYKNDDYSLSAMAKFVTPCSPNKEIETSELYSDGLPKVLKCNEEGDALHFLVKWNDSSTDFIWEESLGGFSLRENFTYWDFSSLDQEVTLNKAK